MCKFLIKLYGGNTIKLTSIHSAFHFIENTTVPHNLGTGKTGTNAFIKMIGCNTVNVSEVYIERQILDYAYHIYASSNITINQHKDVFFGNGLLRLEDSRLITLSNIIRDCNLVSDYDDIYQDGAYAVTKWSDFESRGWTEQVAKAVEIALSENNHPGDMYYFRTDYYHKFADRYMKSDDLYFSTRKGDWE